MVIEVKEIAVFVLLLRCLVVNSFKRLSANIESRQDSRRLSIEQVLPFVNQIAVNGSRWLVNLAVL